MHRISLLLVCVGLLAVGALDSVSVARSPVPASSDAQAAESSTAKAAPDIHVEIPQLDLGSVPEGTKVEAVFTIENRGQAELRILRAKPS